MDFVPRTQLTISLLPRLQGSFNGIQDYQEEMKDVRQGMSYRITKIHILRNSSSEQNIKIKRYTNIRALRKIKCLTLGIFTRTPTQLTSKSPTAKQPLGPVPVVAVVAALIQNKNKKKINLTVNSCLAITLSRRLGSSKHMCTVVVKIVVFSVAIANPITVVALLNTSILFDNLVLIWLP
uniref:Uncharacterized protein n=1 Tax=Glossina brevipalpis TaxID=37001 RepID=A0A1A9X1P9_9MUSC